MAASNRRVPAGEAEREQEAVVGGSRALSEVVDPPADRGGRLLYGQVCGLTHEVLQALDAEALAGRVGVSVTPSV